MKSLSTVLAILSFTVFLNCTNEPPICDVVIHKGTIYNGTGEEPYQGTIAILGDSIIYVGPEKEFKANTSIDASGKAVSPGFINMLSWGYENLLNDGRSLSDLKQGVTLEVFGEGTSPGPQGNKKDDSYISFGEAMDSLIESGVSTNIASFLGATTVRIQHIGYENRRATASELIAMQQSVKEAMEEGAMGIGSSLIYAPGDYADTDELTALCKMASDHGGMYISHMRNEDHSVIEALEELLTIAKKANIPAEIYHLKTSRKPNWHLLDSVIKKVEEARANGLRITADMYTYNASSTGLTGVIPTWVQEGGHDAWIARMKQPGPRKRLLEDIRKELDQQPASGILMVGFNKDSLDAIYRGKTVAEAAEMRNQSPEEAIIDLIIEDDSRIQCIYFSMSEENIRKKIQISWVSFCSDAGSYSDLSKDFKTHPRAFGSFIRVLGKYTREENLLTVQKAIHKLSGLPATNLGIKDRGFLKEGYKADLVVFDPEKVVDHATFDQPLQFAEGKIHVFVNGVSVLSNGEHTGAFPGRFIKGQGAK
ncbi:N-acyl-D-amino-acid deacylase [Flavobacteriaceae bacterium MAR_2010_188]|nr:N-acyl-D-amino-acid deacylase [Flavobacteriaceae bacterium MAR_2010_188]